MTNKKPLLEYVFSGTNMMEMVLKKTKDYMTEEYNNNKIEIIKQGISMVKESCIEILPEFDIKTSLLYNSYAEPQFGGYYNKHDKFGFDSLYADSGGLQVITTGKELTEELKLKIYDNQKLADYGFCFDEIPVENKLETKISGGGRASVEMKVFNQNRLSECALHTSKNINKQLEIFENTNTQCFYIVQGNTYNDMYEWFKIGYGNLSKKSNIAGIALADTCMGNGELESCDMILAAKMIFEKYPELNKRIHLLGIGAATRMLPILLLSKSGFLDNIDISFDSSSNAMSRVYGHYRNNDGMSVKTEYEINASINSFLEYFDPLYKKWINNYDKDIFYNYITTNNIHRKFNGVENYVEELKLDTKYYPLTASFNALYSTWLNIGFFNRCKKLLQSNDNSAISMLKDVKTIEDYHYWRRQFMSNIKSKRMDRKSKIVITDLFI